MDWLLYSLLTPFANSFIYFVKSLASWIITRILFTCIVFESRKTSFQWIRSYVYKLGREKQLMMLYGAILGQTLGDSDTFNENMDLWAKRERSKTFTSLPRNGLYLYWPLWFSFPIIFEIACLDHMLSNGTKKHIESFTVYYVGNCSCSYNRLEKFVQICKDHYYSIHPEGKCVERLDDEDWTETGVNVRNWDSVILDDDLADVVYNDCVKFKNSYEWYTKLGIPYRRCYLLYGPPGTGKSSFVQALASRLGSNIKYMSIANKSLNDELLIRLFSDTIVGDILLIEDVDVAFPSREDDNNNNNNNKKGKMKKVINEDEKQKNGVTLSGLLNAIDGICAPRGCLFFFTTNYIDKLDPALRRPGRMDMCIKLDNASRSQIERHFMRVFPDIDNAEGHAKEFSSVIPEHQLSMAEIQEYLIRYRYNHMEAINSVSSYVKNVLDSRNEKQKQQSLTGQLQLQDHNINEKPKIE